MAKRKRTGIYWWIVIIIGFIVVLTSISGLIVKYLWLDNLGYSQIFWKIKETQFLLFFIALAVALLYIVFNIRYITKGLRPVHLNLGQTPGGGDNVVTINPKVVKIILYVLTLIVSLVFAFDWSSKWNEFFRFAHAQPFGNSDPVFGMDSSFYVFILPFIKSIQSSLIVLVFIITAVMLVYHLASGSISLARSENGPHLDTRDRARQQIFVNIGLWLLLLAVGYYLSRYQLVNKAHGIIYGANYTDVHVLIPVYWVMAIGSVLLAILSFFQTFRYNRKRFIFGAVALFIIGVVGQVFLPMVVQNLKVEPSEFTLEKPYIKNNIKSTRQAYHLDNVDVRDFDAADTLRLSQIKDHQAAIQNVRIWDQNLTLDTYKQLQEIRLYYQFYNIDLDRYHTNKGYRQVLISARELASSLPAKAETWVNRHLQYTHGFGVVMSPTTQKTEEGSPIFYIKDIPPKSDMGLKVDQPSIYYGERGSGYKLVNTAINELDYPKGDRNVYTHYHGKGGIGIDNLFSRLLFAWHFGDINILLTKYIQQGSKIQLWRTLRTRVHKVAPFLKLDKDPYIVLSGGKLYWIQDAYTTASNYPYSEPFSDRKNYIRNSVKVVVDAYQGSVNFYVSNPKDPVIKVYRDIFPKVFKPLDAMPATLKKHVKYPKDLFKIQLKKFAVYHMTDPQVFYNQEDLWERPKENYGGRQIGMQPYYLLGTLPGSKKLQYMLISPMTPKNRDNMISWMVVKSDFPQYGQIADYELPKERLFLGPAQIEAKINQNTEISRQLSLWDQRGSRVIRGNLMVIPIENSFLYVEPVFLFSTNTNIPQLKRVIATTGANVVMEPTLHQAILALYGKTPKAIPGINPLPIPQDLLKPSSPPQLKKVKQLWQELQKALQDRDWKSFGTKMDKINSVLKKADQKKQSPADTLQRQ